MSAFVGKADRFSCAKCLLVTRSERSLASAYPFPSTRVSCYHQEDDLMRTSLNSA